MYISLRSKHEIRNSQVRRKPISKLISNGIRVTRLPSPEPNPHIKTLSLSLGFRSPLAFFRKEISSRLRLSEPKNKGAYILAAMVIPFSLCVFFFWYLDGKVFTVLMPSFTLFRLFQRRTEERFPSTSFKVFFYFHCFFCLFLRLKSMFSHQER